MSPVGEWLHNPPVADTTGHGGIGVKNGVKATSVFYTAQDHSPLALYFIPQQCGSLLA
jgi:hypothetical protein